MISLIKRRAMNNKNNTVQYAIFAIVSFVFVLVGIFIYVQKTYSNKVKSVKVSVNSGPVSPEFQQTQSILITKDSCTFTTVKTVSKQTTTDPCSVQAGKFEQIQQDISTYGVIDKIIANQKDSENDLLGGKKYSFQVTLKDGTTFSTEADNNFIQSIEPFLDNLNLYVPQFSRLGL